MVTKTFYVREPSPYYSDVYVEPYRGKPVACVVYERHKDPDIEGEDYVIFAYSICAPGDEFVKREGRRIAIERLNDKEFHLNGFTLSSDSKASEVVRCIMQCLSNDLGVSRRVKKIVDQWLEEGQRTADLEKAWKFVHQKPSRLEMIAPVAGTVFVVIFCVLLGYMVASVCMAAFGG